MANLSSYLPGGIDPAAVTITGGTINGTTIGASTPSTGAFTTLTATAASTITTADNNPQLTLISTDADANVGPVLKLYRNSGSPADNDILGRIQFSGEDDAGNDSTFGRIDVVATDVSNDTEDARMEFSPAVGDAFTPTMSLTGGKVGIGTTSPASELEVSGASGGQVSLRYTGNSGYASIKTDSGSRLIFSTHLNNEQMRIDENGNVGIGTTSPSEDLSIVGSVSTKAFSVNTPQGRGFEVLLGDAAGSTGPTLQTNTGAGFNIRSAASGFITLGVNAEHMRIDSSGNLLVGRTNTSFGAGTNGAFTTSGGRFLNEVNGDTCLALNRTDGTGSAAVVFFYRGNSAAGQINTASGGTPAFASSSDIRLKDNVTDHESELANVMSLRPVRWDWNNLDGISGEGFIAQELEQTAWADLVSEGDDGYKQVSGLGAVETRLIKAIQEQQAIIEELKAEVAALKGA